jgi:hypothetical protein
LAALRSFEFEPEFELESEPEFELGLELTGARKTPDVGDDDDGGVSSGVAGVDAAEVVAAGVAQAGFAGSRQGFWGAGD